jgi:hypothetical protein
MRKPQTKAASFDYDVLIIGPETLWPVLSLFRARS